MARSKKLEKSRTTSVEHRAMLLAVAYDALELMRYAGLGYPTLSLPMAAIIGMEAEDRGLTANSDPEGAFAVAHISNVEQVIALAKATLNETQRAIVVATAIMSFRSAA